MDIADDVLRVLEDGDTSEDHVDEQDPGTRRLDDGSGEVGPEVALTVLEAVSQLYGLHSTVDDIMGGVLDITSRTGTFRNWIRTFEDFLLHQQIVELLQLVSSLKCLQENSLQCEQNQSNQQEEVGEEEQEGVDGSVVGAELLDPPVVEARALLALVGEVHGGVAPAVVLDAVGAVQRGARDDGGGHEHHAEHHQPVDEAVIQRVPPRPERLLRLAVAEHPPHQRRAYSRHPGALFSAAAGRWLTSTQHSQ